jgi:hypothetical protein
LYSLKHSGAATLSPRHAHNFSTSFIHSFYFLNCVNDWQVERRNLVMGLLEEERQMKRQALAQAEGEAVALPGQGSFEELHA